MMQNTKKILEPKISKAWKLFVYGILRKKHLLTDLVNRFMVGIRLDATIMKGVSVWNDGYINYAILTGKPKDETMGVLLTWDGEPERIMALQRYLDMIETGYTRIKREDVYGEPIDIYVWNNKKPSYKGQIEYENMVFDNLQLTKEEE